MILETYKHNTLSAPKLQTIIPFSRNPKPQVTKFLKDADSSGAEKRGEFAAFLEQIHFGGKDVEFGEKTLGRFWFKPKTIKKVFENGNPELNPENSKLNPVLNLKRYSLAGDYRSCLSTGLFFETRGYDARYNLCLLFSGRLIASVGFDTEYERLRIKQIQGMKGEREALELFDWKKVLVSTVCGIATDYHIPKVAIVPGDKHPIVKQKLFDITRAREIYDRTALRCGFCLENEDGDFVRSLPLMI